jgi:tetratricopeptide (TPR) repeat protein
VVTSISKSQTPTSEKIMVAFGMAATSARAVKLAAPAPDESKRNIVKRTILVWMTWCTASIVFGTSVEISIASAAESFSAEQISLFGKCEKSPAATGIKECSAAIDSKLFKAAQLAGLHVNRANAYDANGNKDSALKDYNRAVELAPDNAGIYYNRGVLLGSNEDYDSALKDYDAAIRLNPAYVAALYNRGRIFEFKNDFAHAQADFSEAIRLDPKAAIVYLERGSVYLRAGQLQRAVDDENEAVKIEPAMANAYYLRGIAYAKLGDNEKASSDTVKAVQLDPKLASFIELNGQSLAPTPSE